MVRAERGALGITALRGLTRVPSYLHNLPHLARFEIAIGRGVAYDGERHGYLSTTAP